MPRDIETVPDLVGFAAPNGQEGKPRTKFVAVLRDKFPKAHQSLDYLHRRVDRTCSALRSFAFRHRKRRHLVDQICIGENFAPDKI